MRIRAWILCLLAGASAVPAGADNLPPSTSGEFCKAVQKILASTSTESQNTIFTDMPSYRHSKPFVNPVRSYQVVTYRGATPIVVSCKVKTAAHLRAVYGQDAAGEQFFCPEITRRAQAEAVAELRAAGLDDAADKAAAIVVDETEPHATGQAYLSDFQPSYRGDDGVVHLSSPGLFQDYDSWVTRFLPEQVRGQSYCHLPTVTYIKALATGEMEPGTVVTTLPDAPVNPANEPAPGE